MNFRWVAGKSACICGLDAAPGVVKITVSVAHRSLTLA